MADRSDSAGRRRRLLVVRHGEANCQQFGRTGAERAKSLASVRTLQFLVPEGYLAGGRSSARPAAFRLHVGQRGAKFTRSLGRLALYWPATEYSMPEPTREESLARIADLGAQAAGRKPVALSFKVSEKGGVSVYGLGRFRHGPFGFGTWCGRRSRGAAVVCCDSRSGEGG